MKKSILFSFFVLLWNTVFSQCTPDTSIKKQGIYPDSVTNLPKGYAGVPYNTIIQIRVLTDTTISGAPATVDSIRITGITGFPPPDFTYQCNIPNCTWPGGGNGCVLITGNPNTAGTYPLDVKLTAFGKISGFPAQLPQSVKYYKIVIDSAVGMGSLDPSRLTVLQNSPNPFSEFTEILFTAPATGYAEIVVFDIVGKIIFKKSIETSAGINKFVLTSKDVKAGVYSYTIRYGQQFITRSMISVER